MVTEQNANVNGLRQDLKRLVLAKRPTKPDPYLFCPFHLTIVSGFIALICLLWGAWTQNQKNQLLMTNDQLTQQVGEQTQQINLVETALRNSPQPEKEQFQKWLKYRAKSDQ
jgi:hypothetical protein